MATVGLSTTSPSVEKAMLKSRLVAIQLALVIGLVAACGDVGSKPSEPVENLSTNSTTNNGSNNVSNNGSTCLLDADCLAGTPASG
jgi:hypothetical protein